MFFCFFERFGLIFFFVEAFKIVKGSKIEEIIEELNLDLKVAYIDGDDLIPRFEELKKANEPLANMEKGISLHDYSKPPLTANAYFGA